MLEWKQLHKSVKCASPAELGGLKGEAYLRLNPQGKMPLLVLADGRGLAESEVIVQYLLHKFAAVGEPLQPDDPERRAFAALAVRVHDVYLQPCQGCMYKEMPAEDRARGLAELARQLDVLEGLLSDGDGDWVAGNARSFADAALFPTFVFYTTILPAQFNWPDVFSGRPRLRRWWVVASRDAACAEVKADIEAGLAKWAADGRWEKLGIAEQVRADRRAFIH